MMKNLPGPEVYEKEFRYMPWGKLIERVLSFVKTGLKGNASVLDLMCGPGYFLGKLNGIRPDLTLEGIDINSVFIKHATQKYKSITFTAADALEWSTDKKYDLILCTAGLHHVPYEKQSFFIKKTAGLLKSSGFCIFADPYIGDYSNELERKCAAAKLGYEYLVASIRNGADDDIINACVDILHNDVCGSEFKTSLRKLLPIFQTTFKNVEVEKIWPDQDEEFGDYIILAHS